MWINTVMWAVTLLLACGGVGVWVAEASPTPQRAPAPPSLPHTPIAGGVSTADEERRGIMEEKSPEPGPSGSGKLSSAAGGMAEEITVKGDRVTAIAPGVTARRNNLISRNSKDRSEISNHQRDNRQDAGNHVRNYGPEGNGAIHAQFDFEKMRQQTNGSSSDTIVFEAGTLIRDPNFRVSIGHKSNNRDVTPEETDLRDAIFEMKPSSDVKLTITGFRNQGIEKVLLSSPRKISESQWTGNKDYSAVTEVGFGRQVATQNAIYSPQSPNLIVSPPHHIAARKTERYKQRGQGSTVVKKFNVDKRRPQVHYPNADTHISDEAIDEFYLTVKAKSQKKLHFGDAKIKPLFSVLRVGLMAEIPESSDLLRGGIAKSVVVSSEKTWASDKSTSPNHRGHMQSIKSEMGAPRYKQDAFETWTDGVNGRTNRIKRGAAVPPSEEAGEKREPTGASRPSDSAIDIGRMEDNGNQTGIDTNDTTKDMLHMRASGKVMGLVDSRRADDDKYDSDFGGEEGSKVLKSGVAPLSMLAMPEAEPPTSDNNTESDVHPELVSETVAETEVTTKISATIEVDVKSAAEPEHESSASSATEPEHESSASSAAEPEHESSASSATEPEHESSASSAIEPEHESDAGSETSKSEGDNEANSESEAESEPEKEPSFAEPSPDWSKAKAVWQGAWEFHIYFTGFMFCLLAVYSLLSIILLSRKRNLLSLGYFISLHSMLLVAGVTRALYLLLGGYNSTGVLNDAGAYFLSSTIFPCLTSAFSILFFALLLTTKMQMLSPRVQKPQVLIGVIIAHFTLSTVTDIVVGYYADSKVMLLVCEAASILWGLILSIAFMYIFKKLFASAVRRQKQMQKLNTSTQSASSPLAKYTTGSSRRPRLVINLALKVTMVTAVCGIVSACLQVYGMTSVYNIFSTSKPQPWPWWGFQFGMRIVELVMCFTMSYVATQPLRYSNVASSSSSGCTDVLRLLPCFRWCHPNRKEDEESTFTNTENYSSAVVDVMTERSTKPLEVHDKGVDNGTAQSVPDVTEGAILRQHSGTSTTDGSGRPRSMLVREEGGFIRFRHEDDPEGDPIGSTDDELDCPDELGKKLNNGHISNGIQCRVHPVSNDLLFENHSSHWVPLKHMSVPNTGTNTPATPRSYGSNDLETGVFNFRPPSSIHLRDSIDRALNYPDFSLRTPDLLSTPDNLSTACISPHAASRAYFTKHNNGSSPYPCPPFPRHVTRRASTNSFRSARSSLRTSTFSINDMKNAWQAQAHVNHHDDVFNSLEGSDASLSLANSAFEYSPLPNNIDSPRKVILYRCNSDSLADFKSDSEVLSV